MELGNEVPDILFDLPICYLAIFLFSLKLNQLEDIDEIDFKSRNYK